MYCMKLIKGISIALCIGIVLLCVTYVDAKRMRTDKNPVEQKEFQIDEMYISQMNIPFAGMVNVLPNRSEWYSFINVHGSSYVYFDPRSGRPTSITAVVPLIPGSGEKNTITLESLSKSLGYNINSINDDVVREAVLQFIKRHETLLGINTNEFDSVRATQVTYFLWQVFITRQFGGIPVRGANMSLTINHGNLVLWGLEKWGDIGIKTAPSFSSQQALQAGFAYIDGQAAEDKVIEQPHLELISVSSDKGGFMGQGYGYRLAWVFSFHRDAYPNNWEILVDAHTNQVIQMRDRNLYAIRKIVGATYSKTNDDCCPEGCPEYGTPMAYTDTGFASPNNLTDLMGLYNYTSGTVATTLVGSYVNVNDRCGNLNESSTTGDLDLAGTYNEHDCTNASGHSAGDTFAARTCAAEVAQTNRIARGWVNYTWLDSAIECQSNYNQTCNSLYFKNVMYMDRGGGGCRNIGEEVTWIDHEWGHGLDEHDANGTWTNPEEIFADLVAQIKLHANCSDRGSWWTHDNGCGGWTCPTNPASSGFKCDGYGDCCLECTGLRDTDWAKHVSGIPHTPANFNCPICTTWGTGGPCNGEVHCENAPGAEAGWDLAARDLQAAPFNLDRKTAFLLTEKIMIQGTGNVTDWFSCNCTAGTSDGCAATSGYMQWIAADDDDGNLSNGTPHMTALYAAYNRHQIACATPTAQNSGCTSGPTQEPVLTATPTSNGAVLTWTAVPNAANYYVLKGKGPWGCDMEKPKIATVTGTTYTDQTMDCYQSDYQVVPVGSNPSCIGRVSSCVVVIPPIAAPANVTATATAPNQVTVAWSAVTGATGYNVYRQYTHCGTASEDLIASNLSSTNYIDNATVVGVTNYYAVTAIISCETTKSSWASVNPTGTCSLTPCFNGSASAINNTQTNCSITVNWSPGNSSCAQYPTVVYDIYRSTDPAFVPGPSNLLTSCLTGSSYIDSTASFNTTYYYIASAEDGRTGGSGPCNGGNTDANVVRVSAAATGPISISFSDGFEMGTGNWTISANWQQSTTYAHTGTHSFWSNDLNNIACTTARNTNPIAIPAGSASPILHFWTRFTTEDGRDAGIVESSTNGTTWTKLTLIPNYPGQTVAQAPSCLGTNPQPAFTGTNNSWTEYDADLTSFAGGNFYFRFNYATDNNGLFGGWYIDDVLVQYGSSCTTGSQPPGTVLNNLTITKSGTNLNLSWSAPGGTCSVTGYGVYRGTLPFTTYNHASLSCSVSTTSFSTPQDTSSYYYLVVPLNTTNEGSYGTSSSGTQRPQGSSPCHPQNLISC